jgi:hypothetical protein
MRVDTLPVTVELKDGTIDTAYRVTVTVGNSYDNTEETIWFAGLFLSWPDSLECKTKIIEKIGDSETGFGDLDLTYWLWDPKPDAHTPALREEPLAQEWTMGRDSVPGLKRKIS